MGQFPPILGALGLFLFGLTVMSEGIQKAAGQRMRSVMSGMTKNRFYRIMTGLFITSLIQSSSATTVLVVSFVNAQRLTLFEAIGIIFGANLGPTLTFWIISLFGFKFSLSSIARPIIGIGLPMHHSTWPEGRKLSVPNRTGPAPPAPWPELICVSSGRLYRGRVRKTSPRGHSRCSALVPGRSGA